MANCRVYFGWNWSYKKSEEFNVSSSFQKPFTTDEFSVALKRIKLMRFAADSWCWRGILGGAWTIENAIGDWEKWWFFDGVKWLSSEIDDRFPGTLLLRGVLKFSSLQWSLLDRCCSMEELFDEEWSEFVFKLWRCCWGGEKCWLLRISTEAGSGDCGIPSLVVDGLLDLTITELSIIMAESKIALLSFFLAAFITSPKYCFVTIL